ncbi:M48 family metalloprotease [bacterium]|nr:M48 family metalloprotease [bacterium]
MSLVALAMPIMVIAADIDSELGDNEVKLGKESAKEVAKNYKLSDNAADLKHLRDMGAKIASVANKTEINALYGSSKVTPFDYTFDIIEDKDINAFSVPGGHIYVYRGLLNFVQSDHELAGVVAHEIIHAAHHHMVYLLKKQATLNNQLAIALLATMIGGVRSADMQNVLMGVQLYQVAILNGYGQEAERDADNGGAILMQEAGYNPVGLLTFLERLAKRPELVDYGIYRSHPLDDERVKAAKAVIEGLGLPINRRQTTNAIVAQVTTNTVDDTQISDVSIDGKVIYRPAPTADKTSEVRAKETADRINKALDSNIQMYELSVDPLVGGVVARGEALLVVSEADGKLMDKTPAEISKEAAAAIRNVIWRQLVDTIH